MDVVFARRRRRVTRILLVALLSFVSSYFALVRRVPDGLEKRRTTTTTPSPPSSCIARRGRNGTWFPSDGYRYPGRGDDDAAEPVARHTRWEWRDRSGDCPIMAFDRKKFCDVMYDLDLKRIFFVGDSLQVQMFHSLRSLLGIKDAKVGYLKKINHFRERVECTEGGMRFEFEISFVRNDHLSDDSGECSLKYQKGDLCLKWSTLYGFDPRRTLLIASSGPHVGSDEDFGRVLDGFVDIVHSMRRPADVIVFRTAVPGHEDCGDHDGPLDDVGEFRPPRLHNWGNFEGYNEHAATKWENLTDAEGDWMFLDVYPMTILRPDGHKNPNEDCLRESKECASVVQYEFTPHISTQHLLDVFFQP